jgi:mannan endo-1,4-beta-mannosidase
MGQMTDPYSTDETRALFFNLKALCGRKILFGHQHTTSYGIGWKNEHLRCDVKDVTGSFPAVYGWDYASGDLEKEWQLVIDAHERGGVNTFSWHIKSCTGGTYKKVEGEASVRKVLPGGEHHEWFIAELDRIADFTRSLKDAQDRPVPIIFRPWHEHTGDWFWWGTDSCSPEEFIALWRFTLEYLRDEKQIHQFIWGYSPSQCGIAGAADYKTNRFPGYDMMDLLGIDCYTRDNDRTDLDLLRDLCRILVILAREHGKIPALTEFGVARGFCNTRLLNWYTGEFLSRLKNDEEAWKIAYALTWRNADKEHFWVPYPGHPQADDFRGFRKDPLIAFEDDLPDLYTL